MAEIVSKESKESSKRIEGLDFARSLAIVGMIVVNFKIVMGASETGSQWLITIVNMLSGRAAAVFVILAGIGISLMTKKAFITMNEDLKREKQILLLKRAIFLFIIGLLYSPIWPADILHYYGLYLMFASLFLYVEEKKMFIVIILAPIVFLVLAFIIPYEQGWNFETLDYVDFWTVTGFLRHLFYNGFHPFFPWISFLFIGMMLGRKNLNDKNFRKKLLRFSLVLTLVTEVLSLILVSISNFYGLGDIVYLVETEPMPPFPLYVIAASATALVIIILSIEIVLKYPDHQVVRSLISTGQLALSLYIAHVIIGMGLLFVLGCLEDQSLVFSLTYSLVFIGIAILFSTFWQKRYERGPIEFLMRKLTG